MKPTLKTLACTMAITTATACSNLSDRAQEMTGNYYEPAISETTPTMELNPDGTCTIRAISPGVLSYSIKGTWNVLRDTLFVDSDGKAVEIQGDSTLIGDIATHLARPVVNFTGSQLTLKFHDSDKVYIRR